MFSDTTPYNFLFFLFLFLFNRVIGISGIRMKRGEIRRVGYSNRVSLEGGVCSSKDNVGSQCVETSAIFKPEYTCLSRSLVM